MTTESISQKKTTTFRMECRVSIHIRAPREKIWALLTNADEFPRWNSTVTSIKGPIANGQKLEIRVPVADRTFTPKVTELVSGTRMVWSDGMASRGSARSRSPRGRTTPPTSRWWRSSPGSWCR